MATKGRTLRIERLRKGIKQQSLAETMGVHRNSVKRYEDLGEVPSAIVSAYRNALATLSERSETS